MMPQGLYRYDQREMAQPVSFDTSVDRVSIKRVLASVRFTTINSKVNLAEVKVVRLPVSQK